MKEVFGVGSVSDDDETIMKNFQRYAQNTMNEILRLEPQYRNYAYPGKKVLDSGKKLMQSVIQIQALLEFFTTVSKKREAFYDFAEDYEPVKAFFGSEQQEIFTRALDMLAIYEDSKTYIVDSELEEIVHEMRSITRQDRPYSNIPKLPALREKFMNSYRRVLEKEERPVLDAIDQARQRVLEVLETKEYAENYRQKYSTLFAEIRSGAEHCNNVSALRSYADKAEALKIRILNEMTARDNEIARRKAEEARRAAEEAARKAKEEGRTVPVGVKDDPIVYKVKKTKNVTIKNMTHTSFWRLESAEDVEKALDSLRNSLLAELNEYDILNVEF